MIKAANILMVGGVVMCLFPFNDYFFAIARLVWGLGAGSFTVFVPKYITEIAPVEMSGTLGGLSQFMCCLGILVPSLLALAVPASATLQPNTDAYVYWVDDYWRYAWSLSIAVAVLQLVCLQFCFNYETPVQLKENSEWDKLTSVMRKLYRPEAVQSRVLGLKVTDASEDEGGPSMWESFTDPAYRAATILGCMLMVLQQLSGINVLIFYSSTIFATIGKSGAVGAAITNTANLMGAIGGMSMLAYFGRKTILCTWSFFMAASMILMGNAYIQASGCPDPAVDCPAASQEVYYCVAFVVFFEFGMGVIPWLYMAEIMTNSGMSAGVVTNQVFTLLISLLSNSLLSAMGGWVFIMFGSISVAVSAHIFLIVL